MNIWTQKSIELANSRDYLDLLFEIYPIQENPKRNLPTDIEETILNAFEKGDYEELIKTLLTWEIFPVKDSYVAYLRNDQEAILRNPKTVKRLGEIIVALGPDEVIDRCTAPKETNRQMGPLFKKWIEKGELGVPVVHECEKLLKSKSNCVYNASDEAMKEFANRYLGFTVNKGLDFIGKFNRKYVIGEAKFLTDFGGHQTAQFNDAMTTAKADVSGKSVKEEVIPIAILDGALYMSRSQKMNKEVKADDETIALSALLLREFTMSL